MTEQLGFELSGDGEHDFLWIEKTGLNTADVARALSRYAGVAASAVGYAGLKDRHAVTRQWFSVQRAAGRPVEWSGFALDGVRLLDTGRNRRKLRRGAHRGNRFELTLREPDAAPDALDDRLCRLRDRGVPNYFGEQRFGRAAGNLELAAALFGGRRLPRERRSLALSAARALIFNEVLSDRVLAGSWDRLLPGDVANLDGSGSLFPADTVDADLARRAALLDLHPTGPLWGRRRTGAAAAAAEAAAAARHPALAAGLEQWSDAARRALRVRVAELTWEHRPGLLLLAFGLPPGAYATSVVRELVRYGD